MSQHRELSVHRSDDGNHCILNKYITTVLQSSVSFSV